MQRHWPRHCGGVDLCRGPLLVPVARDQLILDGPAGASVTSTKDFESLTLTLDMKSASRTLLDLRVRRDYSFNDGSWSPDGNWNVIEDSASRLLVVSTDSHPVARLLVDGG